MKTVLVVSPHPDDEALGCGGVLRQHALAGDRVEALFLTSGTAGGHGRTPAETGRLREAEAHAAAVVLGLAGLCFWRQPDGHLRATAALAGRLAALLDELRVDRVYVPHLQEDHPDHRAAARLVLAAVSRTSTPPVDGVYLSEVWTPLRRPDVLVDVSDQMSDKLAAVRAHATQCAVMDFAAAVAGLNRYRGEMHSWPGGPYAEAFARWPT